jgi:hypothetical protein
MVDADVFNEVPLFELRGPIPPSCVATLMAGERPSTFGQP